MHTGMLSNPSAVPSTVSRGTTMQIGETLSVPAVAMRFSRNEEIYGEDEPSEFVYQVVKGAVRTTHFLEDGRRQIGAFHLPGDIFGFDLEGTYRFSAEAIIKTELLVVRRSVLEKVMVQDPSAARSLWALAATHLRHAQDLLVTLGRRSAIERVSAFLLEMARRRPGTNATLELPMSRCDIADYLGLTLETVSRTMSQLERAKTIALSGARCVTLRNQSALAESC